MSVIADDAAVANEPYRVHIRITNITTGPEATPVYNPVIQLYPVSGSNFIYQPRERLEQGTAVIAVKDLFRLRDFTRYRRPPSPRDPRLTGVFGSLEEVNAFLIDKRLKLVRKARRPNRSLLF